LPGALGISLTGVGPDMVRLSFPPIERIISADSASGRGLDGL
jgi:hypothetical protein